MPSPALIEKLYAEVVVGCETGGCRETFVSSEDPAEPVEAWSVRAAIEADRLGWTVSVAGKLRCPMHGNGSKANESGSA